jgi:hypothetical protein
MGRGASRHVRRRHSDRQDDDKIATMPGETVPHRAMITACAIGATVPRSLDQTIANVALPYMQGSFSASYDERSSHTSTIMSC